MENYYMNWGAVMDKIRENVSGQLFIMPYLSFKEQSRSKGRIVAYTSASKCILETRHPKNNLKRRIKKLQDYLESSELKEYRSKIRQILKTPGIISTYNSKEYVKGKIEALEISIRYIDDIGLIRI
jgi:uncharacterized protein YbgA (DUF1722 family)